MNLTAISAYVPELPAILITAESSETLTTRAAQAIWLYLEELQTERSPTSELREIEVELNT